jgi:hypothetical protein
MKSGSEKRMSFDLMLPGRDFIRPLVEKSGTKKQILIFQHFKFLQTRPYLMAYSEIRQYGIIESERETGKSRG